jgi:hypothetical protein
MVLKSFTLYFIIKKVIEQKDGFVRNDSCIFKLLIAVLWILDILLRIWIRGSVPLTNGSGSVYLTNGSESGSRRPKNKRILIVNTALKGLSHEGTVKSGLDGCDQFYLKCKQERLVHGCVVRPELSGTKYCLHCISVMNKMYANHCIINLVQKLFF